MTPRSDRDDVQKTMESDTKYDLRAVTLQRQVPGGGRAVVVSLVILVVCALVGIRQTSRNNQELVSIKNDLKESQEALKGLRSNIVALVEVIQRLGTEIKVQQADVTRIANANSALQRHMQQVAEEQVTREKGKVKKENTAGIYMAAFDRLRHDDQVDALLKNPRLDDPKWRERAAAVFEENVEIFEMVGDALVRGACRFPFNMKKGFAAEMPHLKQMRTLSRYGLLAGKLKEALGHANRAIEIYPELARLGQDAARGGPLISALVGVAVEETGLEAIEKLLHTARLDADHFRELIERMDRAAGTRVSIQESLRVEQELLKHTFGGLAEGEVNAAELGLEVPGLEPQQIKESMKRYMKLMSIFIEAAGEGPGQVRRVMKKLEGKIAEDPLTRQLFPAIDRAVISRARTDARAAILRNASAALLFKLQRDRFPESLKELAGHFEAKQPIDPFSGEPLKYLRTDDGPVIYSVGPDGDDDQARVEFDLKNQDPDMNGDIIFRLRRK